MRGLSGFGAPAGFAPAGVVVDAVPAGFVPVVVVVDAVPAGFAPVVVVEAVPLPLPVVAVPEVLAGVDAGVEVGGNEVNGVGSGGNGFDRMPATIWSSPSVLSPFLNLYQLVRLSFQPVFAWLNFASVAASATARA